MDGGDSAPLGPPPTVDLVRGFISFLRVGSLLLFVVSVGYCERIGSLLLVTVD